MSQDFKVIALTVFFTLLVIAGGAYLAGKASNPKQETPTPVSNPSLLIKDTSHTIASDSAKITIVEFGDFECPSCAQAYPIVKQVLDNYKDKVSFTFRNFPLSQHKNARIAAEAAEAAGSQGKYWEMFDLLYPNQKSWAESNNPLDIFSNYAQTIGIDVEKFKNDVIAEKYKQIIDDDYNDGIKLGISATPTFFINNKKYTGVQTYETFQKLIEQGN